MIKAWVLMGWLRRRLHHQDGLDCLFVSLHDERGDELAASSYSRVPLPINTCELARCANGDYLINAEVIVFPEPIETWGRVAFYDVWDAPVGGAQVTEFGGPFPLQSVRSICAGDFGPIFAPRSCQVPLKRCEGKVREVTVGAVSASTT